MRSFFTKKKQMEELVPHSAKLSVGFTPTPKKQCTSVLLKKHASLVLGFTLAELIIWIGIFIILSTITVIVYRPAQLLGRSRDATRIQDLTLLRDMVLSARSQQASVSMGTCDGMKVYASLPTETAVLPSHLLPSGYAWVQVSEANLKKTDGTGWLPVNFDGLGQLTGKTIQELPIDPKQNYDASNPANNFFYTYSCNVSRKFEFNAKTESQSYGFMTRDGNSVDRAATNDIPLKDGGDTGLLEFGTNLSLLPDSAGLCPVGMIWIPSPGNACIDKYEASYRATTTEVDGTTCSSNCPVSEYARNPWVTRGSFPTVTHTNALTYCSNVGKDLPTDFEWWLAAAGTPDQNAAPADNGPCMIWNTVSTDGSLYIPTGAQQTDDGYLWGVETNPNIKTGTASQCKSTLHVYDMSGNVYEWVKDTVSGGRYSDTALSIFSTDISAINNRGIPTSGSAGSTLFNMDNFSWDGTNGRAGARGWNWNDGGNAGSYALSLAYDPSFSADMMGFRCALRRD